MKYCPKLILTIIPKVCRALAVQPVPFATLEVSRAGFSLWFIARRHPRLGSCDLPSKVLGWVDTTSDPRVH